MTLALIDYGAGNLQSVRNALRAAGAEAVDVTADPHVVSVADRIVLPGVGAFAHCMTNLSAIDGMVDAINEAVRVRARPFLGICVGMQLMAEEGLEHGATPGLAWIGGRVGAIPASPGLKIPHMGWNDVRPTQAHPVIEPGEAYFLHSYAFEVKHAADAVAQTDHGGPLVAAVARDNMVGVQFHPEKSQGYGLSLLQRFLTWRP